MVTLLLTQGRALRAARRVITDMCIVRALCFQMSVYDRLDREKSDKREEPADLPDYCPKGVISRTIEPVDTQLGLPSGTYLRRDTIEASWTEEGAAQTYALVRFIMREEAAANDAQEKRL